MAWFRIDNRLVHGQVIEGWIPYLDISHLIVVNDALAADHLQQQIMQLAIPGRIAVSFVLVEQARERYESLEAASASSLFLFATCQDAVRALNLGLPILLLNIGNLHYGNGKKQLCTHVAVTDDDVACLRFFKQKGTSLDFRCVPTDVPVVEEWYGSA